MKTDFRINFATIGKYLLLAIATVACLHTGAVFADAAAGKGGPGLGQVAANATESMGALAGLITAVSFVMGFGFAAAAILKFKAHKDNPAQIPIGTPIALLFIAAALIYLPSLYKSVGQTLFGDKATPGSVKGLTDTDLK